MDGAGRLARSQRSPRPQADLKAAAIGAVVLLRERLGLQARSAGEAACSSANRRTGLIALLERYLPNRAGVAATVLLLLGSAGFGIVKGGHVEEFTSALSDTRNAIANSAGFRITTVAINGRKQLTAGRGARDRRRQRPLLAVVPRRRRRARQAQSQSLDRRSHRAEALSRPAPDRYRRALGVRAVAAGRPAVGDRG